MPTRTRPATPLPEGGYLGGPRRDRHALLKLGSNKKLDRATVSAALRQVGGLQERHAVQALLRGRRVPATTPNTSGPIAQVSGNAVQAGRRRLL